MKTRNIVTQISPRLAELGDISRRIDTLALAHKIATHHGVKPRTFTVKIIGREEVQRQLDAKPVRVSGLRVK